MYGKGESKKEKKKWGKRRWLSGNVLEIWRGENKDRKRKGWMLDVLCIECDDDSQCCFKGWLRQKKSEGKRKTKNKTNKSQETKFNPSPTEWTNIGIFIIILSLLISTSWLLFGFVFICCPFRWRDLLGMGIVCSISI